MATQDSEVHVPPHSLDLSKKSRGNQTSRRIKTVIRSLRVLRGLTPEQVDNFMNSYKIYDLDWADEKSMLAALGQNYPERVGQCLADYYSVLNHLCAIGHVEKMYIPPAMDLTASILDNQILYEESIAKELLLPANAKVLDLGCGRGLVAAHISRVTGAEVTGLNIDADQVASARLYNKQLHLSNTFIRADFNDLPLPLPDNHFDGFYEIQAFSLAKDHEKLCQELFRVLRPGARVSLLDWAKLPAFDSTNARHQGLMKRIKPLIGAVGTPTPESLQHALQTAGFHILASNNASVDGLQAPLIEQADGYFCAAKRTVLGLVRLGLLPQHFKTLFNRLTQDCDAFIEADRARLITTTHHWLAVKPAATDTTASSESALPVPTPASSDTAVNSQAQSTVDAGGVLQDAIAKSDLS
ncbi:Sterol 24-C-methyltransferase [Fulvia fulva]|uniref:Sterol 24-C-methyltransferase n=1 Tax=Passalora fulva TaxID=5499 RepID=A0A9Q8P448_PASFU|nr:Sterol 24-C-methyltransferase [Fulvia fulva]KAK4635920.1 Sterol 24-C-methyltransferase [Fulvia fulva]KAK4637377.1 Sterol 24-C-methyltransferase [Fulvia fulva]UJO12362.1 Sterol 24-C-methyltransferase [Fulvia fulva]WPV09502.1 Sterol 24-C-methyltransferase [Fulvia fulva]WPV23866.1 Sterol 24-C-methyltransferase [Fulvia fulva]